MRKKLEFQADRIDALLSLHKISARVTGGTVTPRWVRFTILPAMGAKISHIKNLHEELAQALNTPSCRVSRCGAAIAIEVPRDDPQPVRLLSLYRQLTDQPTNQPPIPPVTALLGLAEDGTPLLIRLPSPDVAHILVAGTTGSGKTVLLQTMILSLAMSNTPSDLSLILIDPKGSAFTPFQGLPHLARPVIRKMEETVEALHSLTRLMERREQPKPHIIIFIDELVDLLMSAGGKPIQHALTRLTQRGREAGIHIVAATQKPTATVIGTLVKANFPVRLVGRVMCTEDARVATGWTGSGAERLLGRGDFLAVAEGQVKRFQVGHVTAAEIRETVAKMPIASPPSIPLNTPTLIRAVSPVFTLPTLIQHLTEPPDQINRTLALRLINSPLWSNRHATSSDKTLYTWGWISKACRFIFDQELVGTWHHQTRQVLALAEDLSAQAGISTTTPTQAPGEGPRGGAVGVRE